MPSHLDTLRRVYLAADAVPALFPPVDDDLSREAGMNGYLARLLQSARDLDAAETPAPAPTAHTPEPWTVGTSRYGQAEVYDRHGQLVWYDGSGTAPMPSDTHRANAARIVAAVNACAGIADPYATLASIAGFLEDVVNGCDPDEARAIAADLLALLGAK